MGLSSQQRLLAPQKDHIYMDSQSKPRRNVIVDKLEGTKDGQLLDDNFIGRKTFYALSGIWTHVPLITGRVWSPLIYLTNQFEMNKENMKATYGNS